MARDKEHRFDRGSWLALGFVLLMIIASATMAVMGLARVGDGCLLNAGSSTVAACVGDWPASLRPGDEVIAIDGVTVPGSAEMRQPQVPPGWADGSIVHYIVRRGGQTVDLQVPLRRMGTGDILRAFGYGLRRQAPDWNTLVFLGILVIFALAPRAQAAQLLLVAIGGLTAVTTLYWPGISAGAWFAATPIWAFSEFLVGVWGWLFVPTILMLALSFPRRVWPLTRWPRLACAVIYGVQFVALAVSFLTTNINFSLAALGVGALAVVVALVGVTANTFVRMCDPVIRAQTAWLALGLVVGLLFSPLLWVLGAVFPGLLPALGRLPWWVSIAYRAPPVLAFPVCLGIAITRYRLFDIEVIIRRTLVYTLLTAVLALVYLGSVVVLQRVLSPLFGPRNTVAIVASTLAIAALMQPLRRRIQTLIDRRFFRRKYDAARTLARFSARLRNEVEMEVLTGDLLAVVVETLQPAHVSLWLCAGSPERPEQTFDPKR